MRAYRRRLGVIAAAILVLVMIGALLPDPVGTWRPFDLPRDRLRTTAWLAALPAAVSRYVASNFGYGRSMPLLRGITEYAFSNPSDPRVFIGRNAHLYYNGENVVGQSTGSIYRPTEVRHFVDMADALRRALATTGGKLLVMLPPNAPSVATRDLPSWWHVSGPLEYDLAMTELRQRGIATIDLKAALTARPDADELYRTTDGHWRWSGALVAFNLAMNAIGHGEWSLDPATSLSPVTVRGGDLARLIGLQDYLSDQDYVVRGVPGGWTATDVIQTAPFMGVFIPFAYERAPSGVRILVLGDSFTQGYWDPMLQFTGAARVGWMHHGFCTFDFNAVERFEPTIVILAPTERSMPCPADNWPRGLPHGEATASR
jgi:hypothetical protein